MDPIVPELEKDIRRRRRRRLFGRSRIPVRMMVPNFVTLFGLCAGLTSIRMSIEGRWELALAAIVFAAMLDGLDGRVARLLRASSRFGAELDSLADFVNFGVAPAVLIFTWGLGDLKSLGWICVLIFALASALRLARFNVALDDDKPKWQSNYFMGMPTPAAAIVVLLPLYLENLGLELRSATWAMNAVLVYTVAIAIMMVSAVPTYSGKLLGERINTDWVLPIFVLSVGLVACLVTYPYGTLAIASLLYLGFIPLSCMRYRRLSGNEDAADGAEVETEGADVASHGTSTPEAEPLADPDGRSNAGQAAQVVGMRRKP